MTESKDAPGLHVKLQLPNLSWVSFEVKNKVAFAKPELHS